MRIVRAVLILAVLAGCGSKSSSTSAQRGGSAAYDSAASGATAEHASMARAPHEIPELTDQVIVFECHTCGRFYDSPGKCAADQSTLYPAKLTYLCPADQQPTAHAGKCPRCAQNARIMKTAMGPEGLKVARVN